MNEPHFHKKTVTCFTKTLKWLWYDMTMIQLQNQQFINNALHEPAVRRCSKNLLVFSKVFLKVTMRR